ncbi:MAG: formylglycine-generating enzyme family protein [Planctomycetota bacterium]
MGDDEIPRQVTISDGFWIADTTCTQEMWAAVMGNNPSEFKGEKRPVEMVSHTDALEYCDRLNTRIPSLNLRLPTEGEWEYACRSGTDTAFSFGNTISSDQVNFNGNFPMEGMPKSEYRRTTIDCKSMLPNAWGLYQMHGNVSEWCQDWYGDYDPKGVMDPTGPSSGSVRVVRGGGWVSGAGSARSAYRGVGPPSGRGGGVGFRCLSSVNPSAEQASATKSEPRDEAAEERRAQ